MSGSTTGTRLRVGIIGAGWVTQHHLKGWAGLKDRAEVVAIADPDQDRARKRAEEFGIGMVFASAEQMLAQTALDAVDIAAPREYHADLVRLAAQHDLAVLCQKPLAPTYAEAAVLVEEVSNECRLMVHENWRFRSYYRTIARWLAEGRIGEIVQAEMCLFTSGLLKDGQGLLPAIQRQPFIALLDRALVMEILIHHIDTLRFLLGDLSLAYASIGRSSQAMRGEDRASIVFETGTGASVSLSANLAVHGRAPAQADRLTLIGSRGTIELEGDTLQCFGDSPCTMKFDLDATYLQSYASAIEHFVECVQKSLPFETAAFDNLKTLGLVERIYECKSDGMRRS
ncbi:MAG: Gfo/Idh/MocA family oxidoreductase [Pusillimonas sp.]